jgi:hypothetical protein
MVVEDTAENAERCVCPACPTYNDCMRAAGELLYCARGKTGCSLSAVSCACGSCTVWVSHELGGYYYCMKGAAT